MSKPSVRRLVLVATAAVVVLALAACAPEEPKDEPTYAPPEVSLTEPVATSTVPPAKLLTAADVEKISKIKGVKSVKQGETDRATGTLNFANDKGGLFLVIKLGNKDGYDELKKSDTFREKVTGVGDDAFIGPKKSQSKTPNMLVVKKGNDAAVFTVFFSGPDKTVLTMDQLEELANIMAERF
jgi:hypothetical protein